MEWNPIKHTLIHAVRNINKYFYSNTKFYDRFLNAFATDSWIIKFLRRCSNSYYHITIPSESLSSYCIPFPPANLWRDVTWHSRPQTSGISLCPC